MPILRWHDGVYGVGVEAVDRQHRELVRLVNEAHDAVAAGEDPENVRALVRRMADYAEAHFATEERYMAAHGYRDLERHRRDHAVFLARVEEYAARPPAAAELFRFLADWLSAHILEVDAALGRFLRERRTGDPR